MPNWKIVAGTPFLEPALSSMSPHANSIRTAKTNI